MRPQAENTRSGVFEGKLVGPIVSPVFRWWDSEGGNVSKSVRFLLQKLNVLEFPSSSDASPYILGTMHPTSPSTEYVILEVKESP